MTVGIQKKPVVDLEAIEAARLAEEAKVNAAAAKARGEDDEEDDDTPPVVTPPKKKEEEIDWKAKAKASQQEALILKAQIDKAEEEKNKKVEVTDEFLKEKYPEWDDLTTGEQKALKKTEVLEQELQELKNNANQFNNDRKWQEKVEEFTTDELADQFPKIVGREEEFKRFATRPTRKGLPMDVIAQSFLYEFPATEKKRSLFHAPGSAGAGEPETGMTPEEIRDLRVSRPLEYMRLVRAKKIKIKL